MGFPVVLSICGLRLGWLSTVTRVVTQFDILDLTPTVKGPLHMEPQLCVDVTL